MGGGVADLAIQTINCSDNTPWIVMSKTDF